REYLLLRSPQSASGPNPWNGRCPHRSKQNTETLGRSERPNGKVGSPGAQLLPPCATGCEDLTAQNQERSHVGGTVGKESRHPGGERILAKRGERAQKKPGGRRGP